MSKELTATNKPLAKAEDKAPAVRVERVFRDYGTASCMEVSKQTFEEIEAIIKASPSYYKSVFTQGVWPDRRIMFRSISLQASQQFDSQAIMQLKNEFRGAFADITILREQNQEKAQRIFELEQEIERLRGGPIVEIMGLLS